MRKAPATVAIACCAMLSGCVLSGKAAKTAAVTPSPPKPVASAPPPAPPAGPLSIPQTQIELPKPQPIDPAALAVEEPAPAENPPDQGQRPSPTRRNPAPATPGRPEVTPPAQPPPSTTPSTASPAATAPAETTPPITEIVAPAERKRLQDQAKTRRAEVQQILDQFSRRPQLTNAQRDTLTHIRSFMEASLEAENKGDVRQADALAERAQILARDLINAK